MGDTTVILGRQRARTSPICTCRLSLVDGALSVTEPWSSVSSADHSIPAAKWWREILKRCALAGFPVVLRSNTLPLVYRAWGIYTSQFLRLTLREQVGWGAMEQIEIFYLVKISFRKCQ